MKKVLLGLFFFVHIWTAVWFEQQWFGVYNEVDNMISGTCKQQCVVVGPLFVWNDFVVAEWEVQGEGNVIVWFMVQNQIFTFLQQPVSWKTTISLSGDISSLPTSSTIPSDATIVMLFQGNMQVSDMVFEVWSKGAFEKISAWMKSASQYTAYSPRTINFLEWPMWNGKYINQAFLWWLITLLVLLILVYFVVPPKNKRKVYMIAVAVFAAVRILLDIFSTINQKKLYAATIANKDNIMKNGRLAAGSDFYDFLTYTKENTTNWIEWFFLAPYPYGFEGKYHIYPHLSIWMYTWSKVVIYYNPMWEAAKQFWFTEPTITTNQIIWENTTLTFDKVLEWKPYAKIYFIQ